VAPQVGRDEANAQPIRGGASFADLTEGLRYVIGQPVIRVSISMVAVTSLCALSMATLIPAWSVNVLHGNATVNGLLLSARGVGSLAGALLIASLGRMHFRGKLLTAGSLFYPVLLLLFAFLRWLPASFIVLAGVGVGTILVLNLANAIVQTTTPDHLRGRVMGAYTWIFFGFMPIGALWTGIMAEHLGEPTAVIVNALLAMIFFIGVFVLFPKVRQQ
jgi:MFS family permease